MISAKVVQQRTPDQSWRWMHMLDLTAWFAKKGGTEESIVHWL